MPGVSVSIALLHLLLVALVGLAIGRIGMWLAAKSRRVQGLFYGWATELIDLASTRFHVINAFALTDVNKDELSLGYEGTLLDLRQDAGGKLLSATLGDAQAFVIELKDKTVSRRRVPRDQPIPFMVLESENVKNLALSIYFDTASATSLSETELQRMSKVEREALTKALQAARAAQETAKAPPPARQVDDRAAAAEPATPGAPSTHSPPSSAAPQTAAPKGTTKAPAAKPRKPRGQAKTGHT